MIQLDELKYEDCNYVTNLSSPDEYDIEHFLKSMFEDYCLLKFEDAEKQVSIFQMVGKNAKFKGKKRKWWLDQKLYWQGRPMDRQSDEFKAIVREVFDALSTNEDFQKTLLATGNKRLFHSMGKSDPTRTILTEEEFCTILTEIRTRLQNGRL